MCKLRWDWGDVLLGVVLRVRVLGVVFIVLLSRWMIFFGYSGFVFKFLSC